MKNKKKSISWKTVFNAVVFCFCIGMMSYFCFSPDGLVALLNSTKQINILWLVLAIAAHLLNIFLDAVLVHLFLKSSSPEIRLKHSIKASMTGQFFCAVTPGASGGQPMQIITLNNYGIDPGKATSALVQKFLVWQFTLTGYSIAVIILRFGFFAQRMSPVLWVASIIGFAAQIVVIFVLLLISFSPKLTSRLLRWICKLGNKIKVVKNPDKTFEAVEKQLGYFHESNKEFFKRKGFLAINYLLTIVQMTAIYSVPYFVYRALSPDNAQISASVVDIVCAQAFVNMVSSLVPLPGASGAAELSFAGFFGGIFDKETMNSAIFIWRTITYYGTIIVSAPFSGLKKAKKNISDSSGLLESTVEQITEGELKVNEQEVQSGD